MLPVRICAGGVGTTGVPTATGQHRNDEVTRTEQVGWTRTTIGELQRIARQRKQRDCAHVKVCAKGIKTKAKNS
jgi:hypothetical protein